MSEKQGTFWQVVFTSVASDNFEADLENQLANADAKKTREADIITVGACIAEDACCLALRTPGLADAQLGSGSPFVEACRICVTSGPGHASPPKRKQEAAEGQSVQTPQEARLMQPLSEQHPFAVRMHQLSPRPRAM